MAGTTSMCTARGVIFPATEMPGRLLSPWVGPRMNLGCGTLIPAWDLPGFPASHGVGCRFITDSGIVIQAGDGFGCPGLLNIGTQQWSTGIEARVGLAGHLSALEDSEEGLPARF